MQGRTGRQTRTGRRPFRVACCPGGTVARHGSRNPNYGSPGRGRRRQGSERRRGSHCRHRSFVAFTTSELLPGFDQCADTTDVPWLSKDKTDVTLQPGESVDVTVGFNANLAEITQPGTFTAQLVISAKTPYGIAPVPVRFVVNPPRTWGKITGTVTGTECTGTPTPLAGATVQLTTKAAKYTLETDRAGHYQLWLDVRNNPLTVTASKDSWASQTASVTIDPRKPTTADFSLEPDHTCT